MKRVLLASAVALCSALAFTAASACDKTITVVNESGRTITGVYSTNTHDNDWGENLLEQTLPSGYHVNIDVDDGSEHRHQDLLATSRGGSQAYNWDVDVCRLETWTITP